MSQEFMLWKAGKVEELYRRRAIIARCSSGHVFCRFVLLDCLAL